MTYRLMPTPHTTLPVPDDGTSKELRDAWFREWSTIYNQAQTDIAEVVAMAREMIGTQSCPPSDGCKWCVEKREIIHRLEQAMSETAKHTYLRLLARNRRSR